MNNVILSLVESILIPLNLMAEASAGYAVIGSVTTAQVISNKEKIS